MIPLQVSPGPLYHSVKPVRDELYRRFIKRFPCVGCARTSWIDSAHCGPHGLGEKACDLTCIPLCRKCHDLFDADPSAFAASRCLNIPALQRMFQRFWILRHGGGNWWPRRPDLTLHACQCGYEDFQEEFEPTGCPMCGRRESEAA